MSHAFNVVLLFTWLRVGILLEDGVAGFHYRGTGEYEDKNRRIISWRSFRVGVNIEVPSAYLPRYLGR